jgi:signal transduction histidine kinase
MSVGNLSKLRAMLSNCLISREPFLPTQDLLLQCALVVNNNSMLVTDSSAVDEDLEGLTSIELCGLAQGHIVNDILTLSQVQLNIFTLVVSHFSLEREVKQVCSILFNEMRSKGIQHNLTFGSGFKHLKVDYVAADKIRFGQVRVPSIGVGTAHDLPTGYHQPPKQRHQVLTISSGSSLPRVIFQY